MGGGVAGVAMFFGGLKHQRQKLELILFIHDEYFYITTWTRVTAQYGAIHSINLVLSLQLLPVYIKHFRFTQVEVVS